MNQFSVFIGAICLIISSLIGPNCYAKNSKPEVSLSPILISITPSKGPVSGGTKFTLKGKNLNGLSSVYFDGKPATNLKLVNETTVTGVTPPNDEKTVSIVALMPDQLINLHMCFTFEKVKP